MIREFIKLESAGGIVLFIAAILAWIVDNSAWHSNYQAILSYKLGTDLPYMHLKHSILHWINDGLMVIFFFLVGLEIKREIFCGELNSLAKSAFPAIAAVGGMAIPALFFTAFNWHSAQYMRGWAIPTATDIAFSLGVLSLLGSRVPASLKVFLTALAIFDDIGAIVIIAVFYTASISWLMLGISAGILLLLFLLNRFRVCALWPYILIGIVLWICVLQSGVHATVSGILLAFAIPLKGKEMDAPSPLHVLEHRLHPWVAFVILPIFAFANAGVSLAGIHMSDLTSGVTLGILLGLFIGKPLGVFAACYTGHKLFKLRLPHNLEWRHVWGMGLIAGIGFTMSLFIGSLAYLDPAMQVFVRVGVVSGSLLAALCGFLLLRFSCKKQEYLQI